MDNSEIVAALIIVAFVSGLYLGLMIFGADLDYYAEYVCKAQGGTLNYYIQNGPELKEVVCVNADAEDYKTYEHDELFEVRK